MIYAALGDIAFHKMGGTPSTTDEKYWEAGDILWATPGDLGKGHVLKIYDTARKITASGLAARNTALFPAGTVLLSTTATIGNIGLATCPIYCNQQITAIVPHEGLLPEYLAYWLLRSKDDLMRLGGTSTATHINQKNLATLKIPVLPLPKQRRIVDLLSRAEGIVRLRREAEKKAAELIPALFLDMFGDPATNPKGWESKRLGEFCKIIGGSSLPAGEPYSGQDDGLLLMKVSDMNSAGNEVFISSCKEWIPNQKRTYSSVSEGTIVFPKRGAAIATNKKRIVTRPLLLDPNLMGVLPELAIASTDYLFQWFSAFDLADISSGTTVPQLNKGDLTPLVVPIPPMSLQKKFAEKRAAVMSIQAQQASASAKAQATFDALLAQAFSN